jgi:hypothetical protein
LSVYLVYSDAHKKWQEFKEHFYMLMQAVEMLEAAYDQQKKTAKTPISPDIFGMFLKFKFIVSISK